MKHILTIALIILAGSSMCAQKFIETVKTGDLKAVHKMLQKKSTNINETDEEGLSGLMVAAIVGDSLMMDLLLQYKADPNLKTKTGMTALHAAAFHTRESLIPMLIIAGANPNMQDSRGRTPLIVAAEMGVNNPVTLLIQGGADMELKDKYGNTALMIACGKSHLNVMGELLDRGANPNCRDIYGRTPLMLLSLHGEVDMIKLLLVFKPDLEAMDLKLKTAMRYAKENRKPSVVAVLTEAGAKF
jgi:uncharacterized protein